MFVVYSYIFCLEKPRVIIIVTLKIKKKYYFSRKRLRDRADFRFVLSLVFELEVQNENGC